MASKWSPIFINATATDFIKYIIMKNGSFTHPIRTYISPHIIL